MALLLLIFVLTLALGAVNHESTLILILSKCRTCPPMLKSFHIHLLLVECDDLLDMLD